MDSVIGFQVCLFEPAAAAEANSKLGCRHTKNQAKIKRKVVSEEHPATINYLGCILKSFNKLTHTHTHTKTDIIVTIDEMIQFT